MLKKKGILDLVFNPLVIVSIACSLYEIYIAVLIITFVSSYFSYYCKQKIHLFFVFIQREIKSAADVMFYSKTVFKRKDLNIWTEKKLQDCFKK